MKALKYSDVCLIPEYSTCTTRSECSTTTRFGSREFKLPVVPANMKSVISPSQCKWLNNNDIFYIMHRFDTDIVNFVDQANREQWKTISISVGVKRDDIELIKKFKSWGSRIDYITVDIAHGYCSLMKEMLGHIKETLGDEVFVIAGNVCNPEGVAGLASWKRESHVFTINIIVATVPIVFVAFSLTGEIDGSYTSDNIVSNILPYTYLLMGIVLFSTRFLPLKGIDNRMGPALALLIGCVQIFAILPGISRAGITISASLMLGLPRKDAAEFSFMIGIPALLGAIVLDLFENGLNISIIDCIGFFVSMIVGYISIYLVFHLLSKSRFWYFSFYCWLVSLISIIIKYQ